MLDVVHELKHHPARPAHDLRSVLLRIFVMRILRSRPGFVERCPVELTMKRPIPRFLAGEPVRHQQGQVPVQQLPFREHPHRVVVRVVQAPAPRSQRTRPRKRTSVRDLSKHGRLALVPEALLQRVLQHRTLVRG